MIQLPIVLVTLLSTNPGSMPTQPLRSVPPVTFGPAQLDAFAKYEAEKTGNPPYGYELFQSMGGIYPKSPTSSPTRKSVSPTNRR